MATHGSTDFWPAIDPVANREFYGGAADVETQYDSIFKIGSDDEPQASYSEFAGGSIVSAKAENAPVEGKTMRMSPVKNFTTTTFAGAATISMEAAKDLRNRLARVAQPMGALGRSVKMAPDYLCAQYLDRSHTSGYNATWDNVVLCSASHLLPDGTTWSNTLATPAALDEESLESVMIALRNLPGTDNLRQPYRIKQLIVPSALMPIAEKLSRTQRQVGSMNNDESIVKGTKVQTFDFLTNTTRWFAQTDAPQGLFWDWIEKIQFDTDQVPANLQKLFVTWFRARYGIKNARGIYDSNAS